MRMLGWLSVQAGVLAGLALISWVGQGWGYLLLYVLLLVGLGTALLLVAATRALRRRLRGWSPTEPIRSVFARILSSFTLAVAALVVALVAVGVVARLSSPIGGFPGGALTGERVTESVSDWSFAEGLEEIQVQVWPPDPRSMTTHFFIHDGHLYVGADFLFPFKRWVHLVEEDDRVILRIEGKLYPRRAVRVRDPQEFEGVMGAVARKRGVEREELEFLTEVWFFRMDARGPEATGSGP
jgi:hypothetical protein